MTNKQLELMRRLSAAQVALWEVIDNPDAKGARQMLEIVMAGATRMALEITREIDR